MLEVSESDGIIGAYETPSPTLGGEVGATNIKAIGE
jgi:hypothetical protein